MSVTEIVKAYLQEHGYDGLYAEGECACVIDDLAPCGERMMECKPGYFAPCPPECGEHSFHIKGERGAETGGQDR